MVISNLQNVSGGRRKVGALNVLKSVKVAIKEWSLINTKLDDNSVGALEKEINNLELLQAQGLGDLCSARHIATLRGRLWEVLRIEERAWLQKSRLTWASDGGRNTRFFHLIASNRRRVNSLTGICQDGIIVSKYHYDSNSLLPVAKVKGRPSWLWNNIVKSFEMEDPVGVCLRTNLKIQVGDGASIRFWFDLWISETPLRFLFSRIFTVCSSKQGFIAEFGRKVDGRWLWEIPLRRQLFDWEVEQWNILLDLLHGFRSNNLEADWVRWEGVGDGRFSVKSLVNKVLVGSLSGGVRESVVWRGVAPPKVEMFVWLVIRQRIPVKTELAIRGVSVTSNTLCPLCGLVPESVVHLLFNYSIWHFFPYAILWTVWLVRNDIVFANGRLDLVQLFFLVRTRVASWYIAKFPASICSLDTLISDPSVADRSSVSKSRVLRNRTWEIPPRGFLKLNVDGAMVSNGSKGGIGGIVRNNLGVCLVSFSRSIGPGPPVLAELEAILHGLKIVFSTRRFEKFRLVLECDCSVVMDWISNSSPCPSIFEPLVRQCIELIRSNSVVLRLVPRCVNSVADSLAKNGIG
ncbi:hypothetical protein V6N11_081330 [Hibiscus sabdariffa]|uniref:RNase H type-1 domain-containing protein n=1 Tax=Hibiscus sabdariffa TaxID=183260 RepID=A0ABR2QK53_9ROSI